MKHLTWALSAAALLSLSGCGSSGDERQSGQLIDSPVEGVSYQTLTLSGTTDAQGRFNYSSGEQVSFSIGQIEFTAVDAAAVVTPLTLAGSDDLSNPAVINIARLLQTLDNDQDPDNGIRIVTPAATSALDFNLTPAAFEAQVSSLLGLTLVDQAGAIAHLERELAELAGGNSGGGSTDPLDGERVVVTDFPDGLIGSYTLEFDQENTGSGITDGTVATFEVTANGDLQLPNNRTLSTAFFYNGNTAEYVWLDAQEGLSYELALFNDFVDFNIGNGKKAQSEITDYVYYGKYVTPEVIGVQTPAQILAGFADSYSATVSYNSITSAEATEFGLPAAVSEGDSATLQISDSSVVSVLGYTLDPAAASFGFADKTNDRFGPRYELTQTDTSGNALTLSLRTPGEPFVAFDLSVQNGSDFVGSISSDITPYASDLTSFLTELGGELPTSATLVAASSTTQSYVGTELCDTVSLNLDYNGKADRPQLLIKATGETFSREYELRPENADLSTSGTLKSADFGFKQLSLDGSTITIRTRSFGSGFNGDVLTTDPQLIEASCPPERI